MPRCVHGFKLHGLADFDDVACNQAAKHARYGVTGLGMRQHLGAGGIDHRLVAAGVVMVFMRIQYLRDLPACFFG